MAHSTKGGNEGLTEVAPQKFPDSGEVGYEVYTNRCTEGGIAYTATRPDRYA